MNTHAYDKEQYLALVEKLRVRQSRIFPSPQISSLASPGETEEDFQETLDVVAKCGYDYYITFPYSKRSDTPAAAMENQIPQDVAKERFNRLLALVQKGGTYRSSRFEGSVQNTGVQGQRKRNFYRKNRI